MRYVLFLVFGFFGALEFEERRKTQLFRIASTNQNTGASRAVDLARNYCRQRTAFGNKPLTSFQATQFSLSDALTDLCAARSLVREAAQAIDEKHPVATFRAAAAKRFASDVSSRAADTALQRLGGYGYLSEYVIERLVRDLRVHQIVEGTNEIQRVVMWRELERMDGLSPSSA